MRRLWLHALHHSVNDAVRQHPDSGGRVADTAVEAFGRIDCLVNNAARGPFLPDTFATLVDGVFYSGNRNRMNTVFTGAATGVQYVRFWILNPQVPTDPTPGAANFVTTVTGVPVNGTVSGVLGGSLADILVLGAGDAWFVLDAAQVTVLEQSGLDGAQRPATVTLARPPP